MRIGLDATYSLGDALSGVGVYSRELLQGLSGAGPDDVWDWYYRPRRYWSARHVPKPANVRTRLLSDSLGSRSSDLFHGLNQRLPRRRFRLQVATFHDLFVFSGDYSTAAFRKRFAEQASGAAAGADLIIAVSAFTASQVVSYLRIPPSRIRVIHHGVVSRQIPNLPRKKVVLCVGAIQRRKNQAGLVRAFRALPDDWQLVLAGSYGYGADETLREIEASPCSGRIRVTGYLSDREIASWYGRASIFAFPSFDEGFGMPVLEAMAAGVPVVTANHSALPEVSGTAALLIDPHDTSALADALQTLAANEDYREKLRISGLARAGAFPWTRSVAQTLDVYRELLQASSSTAMRSAFKKR